MAFDDENDENDEISIDFSKIKKFFKRKKKEKLDKDVKEIEEDIKEDIQEKNDDIKELEKKDKEIKEKIEDNKKEIKNLKEEEKDIENIEKEIKTDFKKTEKEEISFDFNKIIDFFKTNKYVIPIIFILIAMFCSVFFRMYPAYLPVTDNWARDTVYNYYRNQFRTEINQQYPNLPDANKNTLVNNKFTEFLNENKEQVEAQIEQVSKDYKSNFQDEDGQTYLLAIDPYVWYGLARNYIESNYTMFGNIIKNGESWYTLRNGRKGIKVSFSFHSFIIANIYRIWNFFDKNLSLLKSQFYFPIIICTLAVIPAFFLGFLLSRKKIGGLVAGIIVAIHSSLLGRTAGGFADTDSWNIIMPLTVAAFFVAAYKSKDLKNKIIFGILTGFSTAVYAMAWTGWWHIFEFILIAIGIFLVFTIIRNWKKIKDKRYLYKELFLKNLIGPISVIISAIFFVVIFFIIKGSSIMGGISFFFKELLEPLWFIQYKAVGVTTLWPNVLTTVAELNLGSISQVINSTGGEIMFLFSLIGIVFLLIPKNKFNKKDIWLIGFSILWYVILIGIKDYISSSIIWIILLVLPIIIGIYFALFREEDIYIKDAVLLTVWFLGTIFASLNGVRFLALITPVFAIAFGVFFAIAYDNLAKMGSKWFNLEIILSRVIVLFLLILLLVPTFQAAHNTALHEIPSMNDQWHDSLIEIKNNTTDAVITSWWDFGHWFVAISERRVTFDGGDQGERIHWVGKSLLSNNEDQSIGILRMLNCGQEEAPHVLENYLDNDTVKAIYILNEIILEDKEDAEEILQAEGLTEKAIKEILAVTHCDDLLSQYYITSEDMIGKAGVWGHFGSWNFKRASMYQSVKRKDYEEGINILINVFNLSEDQADQTYYEIQNEEADQWIADWPGYVTGLANCNTKDNVITCGNGVEVNLDNMDATISTQQGKAKLNSIVYINKDEEFVQRRYMDSQVPYSAALIPEGGGLKCIVMDYRLAGSMFTRLFFFNGHGLKQFKPFSEKRQVTGGKIQVWKVDWESDEIFKSFTKKINEEIKASHILICGDSDTNCESNRTQEEAFELAKELVDKVNVNNFADMAKQYSDGPTGPTGGDLGWFGKDQMVSEFGDAAFELEINEISEPIKTEFGWHIIIVKDKRQTEEEISGLIDDELKASNIEINKTNES